MLPAAGWQEKKRKRDEELRSEAEMLAAHGRSLDAWKTRSHAVGRQTPSVLKVVDVASHEPSGGWTAMEKAWKNEPCEPDDDGLRHLCAVCVGATFNPSLQESWKPTRTMQEAMPSTSLDWVMISGHVWSCTTPG